MNQIMPNRLLPLLHHKENVMKIFSIILSIAVFLSLVPAEAGAYTIEDNYWGGTPNYPSYAGDVIGEKDYYDISKMEVSISGSVMTVEVYSSFFDKIGSTKILNDKTNMGDLFISTSGWNPNGTEDNHYQTDTMTTTGTTWDYVVVLDNHGQTAGDGYATSGIASLYKIQGSGSIEASGLNGLDPNNWVYRDGQLYRFAPGTGSNLLNEGTWAIADMPDNYDKLTFTFDITDLLAQNTSQEWGFHWAMSCGNDVIEGAAPIPNPEPSTFLLTGLGILGAAYLRRKRKQ